MQCSKPLDCLSIPWMLRWKFISLVLLLSVRDGIAENKRLDFALFQAVKKSTYKPAAFFKVYHLPYKNLVNKKLCRELLYPHKLRPFCPHTLCSILEEYSWSASRCDRMFCPFVGCKWSLWSLFVHSDYRNRLKFLQGLLSVATCLSYNYSAVMSHQMLFKDATSWKVKDQTVGHF